MAGAVTGARSRATAKARRPMTIPSETIRNYAFDVPITKPGTLDQFRPLPAHIIAAYQVNYTLSAVL